jgi:hypothetical protein
MIMATQWSLEKELCSLARTRSAGEALRRLGIVDGSPGDAQLEEVEGWTCVGESYTYRFRVLLPQARDELLLKAIVAFSMSRSLTELANEWLRRRRLLEGEGVQTSQLYYAGRALFVEKFVPFRLSDQLKCQSEVPARLFDQVIGFAAILDRHRFCPISPFHGLRTDGRDVFVTDFGQDLGPPGIASKRNGRLLREAVQWLERESGQRIDRSRAKALYAFNAGDKYGEGTRWT